MNCLDSNSSTNRITQNNLSWIEAFLLGHSQCVALEGEKSSEISVTSGVPQGSVLRPILFLLYINDLPKNLTSQVRLFSDDTAVYLTVTNKKDSQTLQQDLQKLEQLEKTWEMHFTPSKCQLSHAYLQGPEPLPNPVCSTWSNSRGSRPCKKNTLGWKSAMT